jgi:hypothetical protein
VASAVAQRWLILRSASPATLARIRALADADDSQVGGTTLNVRLLRSRTRNVADLLKALAADPDVAYAEPNHIVRALVTPNDPSFSQLWGMPKIGAPTGTFSAAAPATAGSYEFRYMLNNGYTDAARSNSVTVQ